jgi:hypothetical protein
MEVCGGKMGAPRSWVHVEGKLQGKTSPDLGYPQRRAGTMESKRVILSGNIGIHLISPS